MLVEPTLTRIIRIVREQEQNKNKKYFEHREREQNKNQKNMRVLLSLTFY